MNNQRFEALLAASNDVAYERDLVTDAIDWSGPVTTFFKLGRDETLHHGSDYEALIDPADKGPRQAALAHHYTTGEVYESEFHLVRHGSSLLVHERGAAEFDAQRRPVRFLAVLRGIEERKQPELVLHESAIFDSVTGHFNRLRLLDSINEKLLQAKRYASSSCYLVVGIDRIDSFGGEVTRDAALVAVSHGIESVIRASDVMGRVGEAELGILLTHCPQSDLDIVAEKIIAQFRDIDVETRAGPCRIILSLGGVTMPDYAQTGNDIMKDAEEAMLIAREEGENRFSRYVWPVEQIEEYEQSLPTGERILTAIKENKLQLAFQPLVSAESKEVIFYECLLRLLDNDGTVIPAKDFIPAVERLGFCRILDRRTLDMAMAELTQSEDVVLALNISGLTVSDAAWMRKLNMYLRHRPDIARRLIIEITETMAMRDMDRSIRFVNQVRALGCRVALDDFGAGYTTFRHLKILTVDIVKIDGAFVKNIVANREYQVFVRTLLDLANAFKLDTVAEFVEDAETAEYLRGEGVKFLQGYHFGKPEFDRPWLPGTSKDDKISLTTV
jgi:diguanylate cyclase (GGDEF)-like protein